MPGLDSERDEDNDLIRWWYWVGIVNRGLMDKFTTSVPSAWLSVLGGSAVKSLRNFFGGSRTRGGTKAPLPFLFWRVSIAALSSREECYG
jgi:hypothetical protein